MRKNRILWFALWILSLVGISFFGGALSYCFFALITSVPIISAIYLIFVYFSFRIYQETETKNVVVGQTYDFYFTLQNESFFSFSGIRVFFFSSFSTISGLDEGIEYELHPGTGIRKQTKLVCKYRGEYEVGVKRVEMQDCFRLFRITFKNPETLSVIVKPNMVHLTQIEEEDILLQTSKETVFNPLYPDAAVREYAPGDSLRYMHWNASAKEQKLLVKKQIGEEQNGISILMSLKRCSKNEKEYLPPENKVLETAIAFSLYYVKKSIPVQLYSLQNSDLTEKRINTIEQFYPFYEEVSSVRFEEKKEDALLFSQALKSPFLYKSRLAILVIEAWDKDAFEMTKHLTENGLSVLVCLISCGKNEDTYIVPTGAIVKEVSVDAVLEEVL